MTRSAAVFIWGSALAALFFSSPSKAYYHYVHYLTGNAPFTPIQEKFDLTALPNQTVQVLVSDGGPSAFFPNDSFGSVVNAIQQAIIPWNSVSSSSIRLAFGGLVSQNQVFNTPAIQVVFQKLPPGVLGFGTPTSLQTPETTANGTFFPITGSLVILTSDTSKAPGPSYTEGFYTTAVHELGHALGLQHTWASAAMSQAVTRNTSKARPLGADDIAGISALYPQAGYSATVGSISGRVTSGGSPVSMASVVAIAPDGVAVSALTNPDGTYAINGIPPDSYYLYAHPLPPDAISSGEGIQVPLNASGQPLQPSGPTETLFYSQSGSGTSDPLQFGVFSVTAGGAFTNINFSVPARSAVAMYDMITYSYFGQTAVTPALVNVTQPTATIVAQENPPLITPVPESITVLGGFGPTSVQAYNQPDTALALGLTVPAFAGSGPRHMLFNLGSDMYVLPLALDLVQKNPPTITAATPVGDGTVAVTGSSFGTDSRVFFDSLPATVTVPFSGSNSRGSLTVLPPVGFSGQHSTLTVFNSDAQNSMLLQSQDPASYVYGSAPTPQFSVAPNAVPAGGAAMVTITGINTDFLSGQFAVGFGTSDITLDQLWVLSPTQAVANVMASPNAQVGFSEVSVISGFQVISQPGGFQVQTANSAAPALSLPLINAVANQQTVFPGALMNLLGSNLALTPTSATITLNGEPAQILSASPTQINFMVPQGLGEGVATLILNNGANSAPPIAVAIANPPPVISAVTNQSNTPLGGAQSAGVGDVLNVTVTGLDPGVLAAPSRLQVTIGGVVMPVLQIAPAPAPGAYQIQVQVTQSFGGQQVPLAVSVDGTSGPPFVLIVR